MSTEQIPIVNTQTISLPPLDGTEEAEPSGGLRLWHVAAAAKLLQLCPALFDPIDGSPPGSAIPGTLQARTLEWVAIKACWEWSNRRWQE